MFYGYIELNKFACTEIHEREVNGKLERCISIPIKLNGFTENTAENGFRKRVFFNFVANDMKPNPQGNSHYISLYSRDKEVVENIRKYDYFEDLRFLGRMRPGLNNNHPRSKTTSIDDAMKTE